MTRYLRTILYLFIFLYWWRTAGSRNPMLRLTIWSHPPQAQRIYSRTAILTLGSNLPGEMSAGPESMNFFIKWSKTNQMGRCVERTKGRHMCPVPTVEAYRECCHCSTHSSPLFHFKDGRPLTSKRVSTPSFYPWYGEAMWLQSSQIQHPHWYSRVQYLPEQAFPLTPFRTSEEVKQSIPDICIGAATVHVN